jgi:hypothetical protein
MIASSYPDQCMFMCIMLQRVNWAGRAMRTEGKFMGADHGGFDVARPHELLDGSTPRSEARGNP